MWAEVHTGAVLAYLSELQNTCDLPPLPMPVMASLALFRCYAGLGRLCLHNCCLTPALAALVLVGAALEPEATKWAFGLGYRPLWGCHKSVTRVLGGFKLLPLHSS